MISSNVKDKGGSFLRPKGNIKNSKYWHEYCRGVERYYRGIEVNFLGRIAKMLMLQLVWNSKNL